MGRPLSDLGQLSYKSYWTEVLVQLLWEEKCTKKMTHSTVSPCACPFAAQSSLAG